jgi:1-acyl-sn-glycerol-3-phosphate acyltransferase
MILIGKLLIFLFIRLEIKGRENIPESGSFILAANHLSVADPVLLGVETGRPVTFMAKEELFRNRFVACIVRDFGAFPVSRGRFNRDALRKAHRLLGKNSILGIFPEGRRSMNGKMQTAQYGAAIIAYHNKYTIVPAGIYGSEVVRGFKWIFKRPHVTIVFGNGFVLPDSEDNIRDSVSEYSSIIMRNISKLLPKNYI